MALTAVYFGYQLLVIWVGDGPREIGRSVPSFSLPWGSPRGGCEAMPPPLGLGDLKEIPSPIAAAILLRVFILWRRRK